VVTHNYFSYLCVESQSGRKEKNKEKVQNKRRGGGFRIKCSSLLPRFEEGEKRVWEKE